MNLKIYFTVIGSTIRALRSLVAAGALIIAVGSALNRGFKEDPGYRFFLSAPRFFSKSIFSSYFFAI